MIEYQFYYKGSKNMKHFLLNLIVFPFVVVSLAIHLIVILTAK